MLVDVDPSEQDAAKGAAVLCGDAGAAAEQLLAALGGGALPGAAAWVAALQGKVGAARERLAAKLAPTAFPLDYHTTLRVVRDELNALPTPAVVVAEGANTMDNARWGQGRRGRMAWLWCGVCVMCHFPTSLCCRHVAGRVVCHLPACGVLLLSLAPPPAPPDIPRPWCCRVLLEPVVAPRSRLDAGTHGTMGVGLGYAIAAAVACPGRSVVAVEGDSAFGFSGMECETICRCVLGGGVHRLVVACVPGCPRRRHAGLHSRAPHSLISGPPRPLPFSSAPHLLPA